MTSSLGWWMFCSIWLLEIYMTGCSNACQSSSTIIQFSQLKTRWAILMLLTTWNTYFVIIVIRWLYLIRIWPLYWRSEGACWPGLEMCCKSLHSSDASWVAWSIWQQRSGIHDDICKEASDTAITVYATASAESSSFYCPRTPWSGDGWGRRYWSVSSWQQLTWFRPRETCYKHCCWGTYLV